MGGARESFGSSGVIVLADDGGLAAQGAGHGGLARLEGIDHVHLKEDSHQCRTAETEPEDRTDVRVKDMKV